MLFLFAFAASPARAQSIALEAGLAGIENYDPYTPLLGAAVLTPTWRRLGATLSYSRWGGSDNDMGGVRIGYGNQAFVLAGLFRLLGGERASFSLGAGVGWFQYFEPVSDLASRARYDRATMASLLVRTTLTPRVSPYLRADVQVPRDGTLHYGLVRLGWAVRIGR